MSRWPSNHLILRSPLLLLPSIFPSIRVFSNQSVLRIRWPKYWSFTFNISPSNEYSFRTDCLDLLTVQGTLKSLLQHHSSKASILWLSAFFIVQLSHPYMTTGKTIALTRQTFVGKDCLCFLICCLRLLLLLNRFSCVQLCATPETAAHQAPLSLGFSRQEHWSGLPLPSQMHESESEVDQSCSTLRDAMDCSLPGSSVHGIFQARVLEWGAIALR